MMTTVSGNRRAIGYISLGSLNDQVKALEIDGAAASVENIKSGAYKIARPFNIATKGDVSAAAQDFINFIMNYKHSYTYSNTNNHHYTNNGFTIIYYHTKSYA